MVGCTLGFAISLLALVGVKAGVPDSLEEPDVTLAKQQGQLLTITFAKPDQFVIRTAGLDAIAVDGDTVRIYGRAAPTYSSGYLKNAPARNPKYNALDPIKASSL